MTVFTAVFNGVTISAAQDLFELVPNATTRIRILEVEAQSYSPLDVGTEEEILGISFWRGHTVSGSGGSTVTPANVNPYSRVSVTAAEANNTTVATTSGVMLYSTGFHVQAGFVYRPNEAPDRDPFRKHFIIKPSQRFVVRITAPADALVGVNGTIIFEEIGKSPQD